MGLKAEAKRAIAAGSGNFRTNSFGTNVINKNRNIAYYNTDNRTNSDGYIDFSSKDSREAYEKFDWNSLA